MLACAHHRFTSRTARSIGLLAVAALGCGCGFAESGLLYQRGNVDVRIGGGDVVPLLQCIKDARSGSLDHPPASCQRITVIGRGLVLRDTVVFVITTTAPRRLLYSGSRVTVAINGGTATKVADCVNDARSGKLRGGSSNCRYLAMAGSAAAFSKVNIRVSR